MNSVLRVMICCIVTGSYCMQQALETKKFEFVAVDKKRTYFTPTEQQLKKYIWLHFASLEAPKNYESIGIDVSAKKDFFNSESVADYQDSYLIITNIDDYILNDKYYTLNLLTLFKDNPFNNNTALGAHYTPRQHSFVYSILCENLVKKLLTTLPENSTISLHTDQKIFFNTALGAYQIFFLIPREANKLHRISSNAILSWWGADLLNEARNILLVEFFKDHAKMLAF